MKWIAWNLMIGELACNINTLGRITYCYVCHTQRVRNVTRFVSLWATNTIGQVLHAVDELVQNKNRLEMLV